MKGETAIFWFRLDLRLADNDALQQALDSHRSVVPVFIWSPDEEAPWQPGGASRWWLHQSISQLQAGLEKRGARLVIRRGPAETALRALVAETGASAVFWNRCYEPAAIARDKLIKQRLTEFGITARSCPGNLLFEPWTIANQSGKPYQVFTAFQRACLAQGEPPAPASPPPRIPAPSQWPASLSVSDLALNPEIDWASGLRETWQPGEAGAAKHLDAFMSGALQTYSTSRDRPDRLGTSRLSPHLHFGEISARQVWHAARSQPAAEPYLRQIVWREFAYHLLFHFPHTAQEPLRPEFREFPWRMDGKKLKAWTQGKTGYPLVDAGMRELWHTGWMHNRVRMAVASFLVKHLLIPWQEGAAWFWDTLVDADLANNSMGWQWTAGCGADAAPYFRIFNPALQTDKFDPQGDYVRRWVPELGTSAYPAPIVDHKAARERALAALAAMRETAKSTR